MGPCGGTHQLTTHTVHTMGCVFSEPVVRITHYHGNLTHINNRVSLYAPRVHAPAQAPARAHAQYMTTNPAFACERNLTSEEMGHHCAWLAGGASCDVDYTHPDNPYFMQWLEENQLDVVFVYNGIRRYARSYRPVHSVSCTAVGYDTWDVQVLR